MDYYVYLVVAVVVGAAFVQVRVCVVASVGYGNDLSVLVNLKYVLITICCSGKVILVGCKLGVLVYGVLDLGVVKGACVIRNDGYVAEVLKHKINREERAVLVGLHGEIDHFENFIDLFVN